MVILRDRAMKKGEARKYSFPGRECCWGKDVFLLTVVERRIRKASHGHEGVREPIP